MPRIAHAAILVPPVMLGLMGAEDGPAGYASEMSMEDVPDVLAQRGRPAARSGAGNLMSAYARLSNTFPTRTSRR